MIPRWMVLYPFFGDLRTAATQGMAHIFVEAKGVDLLANGGVLAYKFPPAMTDLWGDCMETTAHKIKEIQDLSQALAQLQAKGKKVVHCHGVFDLLHIGHIKHLEAARKLG